MREAVITIPFAGHDGWEERGACRGVDSSLFFGPNRFEPKAERVARENAAKTICATCPVVQQCRDFALGSEELFGVWGGLAEGDRRALLGRRAG